MHAGIKYLDEAYPGDGIAAEYDGISLKTGKYDDIVSGLVVKMRFNFDILQEEK